MTSSASHSVSRFLHAHRARILVFVAVFLFGMLWAAVARVAWEDYYITYRASKNLAEGRGLVFTPGERVHSFTSPLGVLLPALSYLLTGRYSDAGALWVFRVISFAALAGAAGLIWDILRRLRPAQPWLAVAGVAWLVLDSKTLTFTAGGMETGLLVFFLGWALWACLTASRHFARHLGCAWGGLMWTRPDACVYIAAMGLGLVIFSRREDGIVVARARVFPDLVRAAALCAVLYLPWFVWAWNYYGSPVPHTIVAKGLFQDNSWSGFAHHLALFPRLLWEGKSSVSLTFLPYYGSLPGQLEFMRPGLSGLAVAMLALLVVPGLAREARFASWLGLAGHVYLSAVVKFPAPWYVPPVAWLGMFALTLALGQVAGDATSARWRRGLVAGFFAVVLLGAVFFAGIMARQCRVTADEIEQPVRRAAGEWLREQAASERETVFLEPLGYIGFYSGLRMLDYPGLAAPDVVKARRLTNSRAYPYAWGDLIPTLRPDWVVMRPFERAETNKNDARVLSSSYDLVRVFDATKRVEALRWVPIPGYLRNDAVFEIYRRKPSAPRAVAGVLSAPVKMRDFTVTDARVPVEDSGNGFSAHAPSRLVVPLREGVTHVTGAFGIYEGAYAQPPPNVTDGVVFTISVLRSDGSRRELLRRSLEPGTVSRDRGPQRFEQPIPVAPPGSTLELKADSGPSGNDAFDWSYWRGVSLESRTSR